MSGRGSGNIIQNSANGGTFSTAFSFNTGSITGGFNSIIIQPADGTTLSGGSANFTIGSSTSLIQGSGLNVIGFPAAASATITNFQVQSITSDNSVSQPHLNMGIEFSDMISNVIGQGSALFQVNQ